jgi:hypothetical protein
MVSGSQTPGAPRQTVEHDQEYHSSVSHNNSLGTKNIKEGWFQDQKYYSLVIACFGFIALGFTSVTSYWIPNPTNSQVAGFAVGLAISASSIVSFSLEVSNVEFFGIRMLSPIFIFLITFVTVLQVMIPGGIDISGIWGGGSRHSGGANNIPLAQGGSAKINTKASSAGKIKK